MLPPDYMKFPGPIVTLSLSNIALQHFQLRITEIKQFAFSSVHLKFVDIQDDNNESCKELLYLGTECDICPLCLNLGSNKKLEKS